MTEHICLSHSQKFRTKNKIFHNADEYNHTCFFTPPPRLSPPILQDTKYHIAGEYTHTCMFAAALPPPPPFYLVQNTTLQVSTPTHSGWAPSTPLPLLLPLPPAQQFNMFNNKCFECAIPY